MFLLITALAILAVACFVFAGSSIRRIFLPKNPHTDATVDELPLEDPDGNGVENIWTSKIKCNPGFSIRPDIIRPTEIVHLVLSECDDGPTICVQNDRGTTFGSYSKEDPHYKELVRRIRNQETVFALLYDKQQTYSGWNCEIKVVVYQHGGST